MTNRARKNGFTLVELMIVVAIIGLLAAISMPSFVRARENVRNGRFAGDLRVASDAFIMFALEQSAYPADCQPGVEPQGMDEFLARIHWTKDTPIGGQWDWDYQQFGVKAGISVFQPKTSASQILRLDSILDDGNIGTGSFRSRPSGYIYLIED